MQQRNQRLKSTEDYNIEKAINDITDSKLPLPKDCYYFDDCPKRKLNNGSFVCIGCRCFKRRATNNTTFGSVAGKAIREMLKNL